MNGDLEGKEASSEDYFRNHVALELFYGIEGEKGEIESGDGKEEVQDEEDEDREDVMDKIGGNGTNYIEQVVQTICPMRGNLDKMYLQHGRVGNH